ncbi:hypothetical protein VCRA2120O332_20513 [Vibrio crassostreae]|nr:hypothetical protein VCRA2120O332_20513 [Vibrio crassostreae]
MHDMQGVTGSSPVAAPNSFLMNKQNSPPSVGFFVSEIPLIFYIQPSSSYEPLCVLPDGVVDLMRSYVYLR